MSTALALLVWMLVLVVGAWVAIFGGIGALLARSRGRTLVRRFVIGVCLGPVGWAYLLLGGEGDDPAADTPIGQAHEPRG